MVMYIPRPRKRRIIRPLTPLELEIMQALWKCGSCTVAELRPKLRGRLAYTTVQTMVGVLLRKKKVKRFQVKRAYRYRAVLSRERAAGSALGDLIERMFGGSDEALLMAMVKTRQVSVADFARIAEKMTGKEDAILKEKQ